MADRTGGDLAIVLHSHMPYVEGFGTYPFGEEWLFDAFAARTCRSWTSRSGLTMTVTPVLADQLEADGVGERISSSCAATGWSRGSRRGRRAGRPSAPAAKAEADHSPRR